MNQNTNLTRKLTAAQELHGDFRTEVNPSVVYRIYTEFFPNLLELTARYFDGATVYFATGFYNGVTEQGGVLEIVATRDDLQKIVHLAGDLKHVNKQSSVLITSAGVTAVSI